MSLCSRHPERDPYCILCHSGVVDCDCGGENPSCSLCRGRGYWINSSFMGWRPISTAPFGIPVLIWRDMSKGHVMGECSFYPQIAMLVTNKKIEYQKDGDSSVLVPKEVEYECWVRVGDRTGYMRDASLEMYPTHWMPLPSPPDPERLPPTENV